MPPPDLADTSREALRGQVPITAEDLARLPGIVESPDQIKLIEPQDPDGNRVIVSRKRDNGWMYWVEEIVQPLPKDGGRLLFRTMYKFRAGTDPAW